MKLTKVQLQILMDFLDRNIPKDPMICCCDALHEFGEIYKILEQEYNQVEDGKTN